MNILGQLDLVGMRTVLGIDEIGNNTGDHEEPIMPLNQTSQEIQNEPDY